MSPGPTPRTVDAVQTSLKIIELLQEREHAGVTEIAEELGRSKGTVHSHLSTLYQNEYLTKDEDGYRLSLRHLELGETVKGRIECYDVVTNELDDLAEESGEMAQFATEEHGRAVYLYKAKGAKAVESASTLGRREYPHCLSLGKAILAQMPEEQVEQIVDRLGLPRFTPNTITSRERLFDELEEIRQRGYAIDDEEKIEGLKCVAAPVMGSNGTILGAVSISGPSSRMVGDKFEKKMPNMIMRSANVIEINTKFS